jgi:hypothetical protein
MKNRTHQKRPQWHPFRALTSAGYVWQWRAQVQAGVTLVVESGLGEYLWRLDGIIRLGPGRLRVLSPFPQGYRGAARNLKLAQRAAHERFLGLAEHLDLPRKQPRRVHGRRRGHRHPLRRSLGSKAA